MDFGEAIPLPLDTADGFTVGRDDLTPPRWNRVKESYKMVRGTEWCRMAQKLHSVSFCVFIIILCLFIDINLKIQTHSVPFCAFLMHA